MNKNTRTAMVLALLSICTLALVLQSYQVYRLNQKVAELETVSGLHAENASAYQNGLSGQPLFGLGPTLPAGVLDPFNNSRLLQRQMDSLFDSFFSTGTGLTGQWGEFAQGSPDIQVKESAEDYQIVIVTPEDGDVELSTNIEDNAVRISGSVSYDGVSNANQLRSSFTSRSEFSRSIPLAKPVDPLAMHTDKIADAIVITIPKA